ncbi:MAG: hypothetical protein IJ249_02525 [Paludibacteraceae bacterium]|nr:hypothetical protein [Paludibacteraceae bacterium]
MRKIYTQPRTKTVATALQQMLCASGGIQAQMSGYKKNTGGFTQTYAWLAGIVCSSLLFLGTACSTANNPDQPKQQAELKPRTLIVTEVESQNGTEPVERRLPQATITENGGVLDALWSIGDEVFYRNLSHNEFVDAGNNPVPLSGTLSADKEASIASFSGDRVWCTASDQLALIYPNNPADFAFYDNPLRAEYTISIAGQDGSLATLAEKYHHIYGIASVVSVTDATANAELAEMKSLLTVCKFSFFVDENDNPLPISKLTIGYNTSGGLNDGKYPQKGTVSIAHNKTTGETVVKQTTEETLSTPLIIDTQGANPTVVYVALFPQTEQSYSFTVTNSDGTYTGEATATLNEGEFVPATIILTK